MATDISTLKNKQAVAQQPKDFPGMLKAFLPEIQRALPSHLNGDRMARIALTAFRRTPKLGDCDPRSVFAAVIQASQLGLEPDTLGRAYLVPYGRECQFVPGWKGLVDLMNRSGQGTVWTGAVFVGDDFDYQLGDSPFVKHKPKGENDPDMMLYAYAVGRAKGAEWPVIEVWPNARIIKHRDRYNKVGKRHYSYENWEMYARKVVLLQVLKYMPLSAELATAIALDDAATVGRQGLRVEDAIEGTWVPINEEGSDGTGGQEGAGGGEQQAGGVSEADRKNDPARGDRNPGRNRAAGRDKDAGGAPPETGRSGAPGGASDDPPPMDGPTLEDAMAAVKRGKFDEARDIARSLSVQDSNAIEGAIRSAEAHAGRGSRSSGMFE